MKTVLICAGGTGGHIFPALEVAKTLTESGVNIHWVGSSRAIEQRLIAPHYPLECLSIESLRGRGLKSKLLLPWRLLKAIVQCCGIIHRVKPNVVLTMGSSVSAPVGVAAWLLLRPLVVHEQNSIAGMANQWLSKLAKTTLTAFPNAFKKNRQSIVVGNPVRSNFFQVMEPNERLQGRRGPLRIFVFGGSQGASALNQVVATWLEQFAVAGEIQVRHQCGQHDLLELQQRYDQLAVDVEVTPFVDNMAEAYVWADLVVSRAGALSIAEIAAVGVASILVPFPFAVDDHQRHNAAYLSESGAAIVIDEKALTAPWLAEKIAEFSASRERLLTMALQAKMRSNKEATTQVVAALQQVALVDLK